MGKGKGLGKILMGDGESFLGEGLCLWFFFLINLDGFLGEDMYYWVVGDWFR